MLLDMAFRHVATSLLPLLVAVAAAAQQRGAVRVAGVVVDARGRAVEGARLGTEWWFDWEATCPSGKQQVWPSGKSRSEAGWRCVETGRDGRFDAKVLLGRRSQQVQLVVYSADYRLGGTFVGSAGEDLDDLRLVLEPVARFRATLTCDRLGKHGVAATAFLRSFDGRTLGRVHADKGKVDLRLPPGHFSLYLYGTGKQDVDSRLFPFAVAPGEDARARDIDIRPNWIAEHRGRAIPLWRAAEARGLDLERTDFGAFAGKWLLVCMWNCESVEPGEDLPQLIRFDRAWRRANPDGEPPYQILLLHSGGARSLSELDEQVAHLQLRENFWGGEPLPFPVLLDPDERTREVWPSRWRRQTLLFDPRGRLWGETTAAGDLERAAAGELEPAVPARPKKK
jgi:hypothetical protein